jgi:hypothetical protein
VDCSKWGGVENKAAIILNSIVTLNTPLYQLTLPIQHPPPRLLEDTPQRGGLIMFAKKNNIFYSF